MSLPTCSSNELYKGHFFKKDLILYKIFHNALFILRYTFRTKYPSFYAKHHGSAITKKS